MIRNRQPRRHSGLLAENQGRPLFADPFDNNLHILYAETLNEARKAPSNKIGKTERAAHMGKLQEIYKTQIAPMAREQGASGEMYSLIANAWGEAIGKGISQEEYNKFMKVLDGIHAEWEQNPDGPHRLGPHVYRSESENMASYVAQWITAGMVGSASVGNRAPGYGTSGWINAQDRGGTATSGREGGGGESTVSRDFRKPRIAGHGVVGPEESTNRDDIAQMIAEDVNDTWDLERTLSEAPAQGTQGAQGGQAAGQQAQAVGPQAQQGTDARHSAADFAEADKAAGIVLSKLNALMRANALTPQMRQKFAQFVDHLGKSLRGIQPNGTQPAAQAAAQSTTQSGTQSGGLR